MTQYLFGSRPGHHQLPRHSVFIGRTYRGVLAFGTVDSFLLWHLTGGREHRTDATNASRTLLFNIHTQQWDPELLELLEVPASLLPVMDSSDDFGRVDAQLLRADILGATVDRPEIIETTALGVA